MLICRSQVLSVFGARVVPIRISLVLLTLGRHIKLIRRSHFCQDLVLTLNQRSQILPIWGTCVIPDISASSSTEDSYQAAAISFSDAGLLF